MILVEEGLYTDLRHYRMFQVISAHGVAHIFGTPATAIGNTDGDRKELREDWGDVDQITAQGFDGPDRMAIAEAVLKQIMIRYALGDPACNLYDIEDEILEARTNSAKLPAS